MGKSEGEVVAEDNYVAWLKWGGAAERKALFLCDSDSKGAFKVYRQPVNTVPAAALDELVKALEEIEPYLLPHFDGISDQYAHHKASDACRSALAHAREIAKGGK